MAMFAGDTKLLRLLKSKAVSDMFSKDICNWVNRQPNDKCNSMSILCPGLNASELWPSPMGHIASDLVIHCISHHVMAINVSCWQKWLEAANTGMKCLDALIMQVRKQ